MAENFDEFFEGLDINNSKKDAAGIVMSGGNPDEAAKALQIGAELNVPPSVVQSQPDTFSQWFDQNEAAKHLKGARKTSEWIMSEKINGELVRDDLPAMTAFEKYNPLSAVMRAEDAFVHGFAEWWESGQTLGDLGSHAAQGLTSIVASPPEVAAIAGAGNPNAAAALGQQLLDQAAETIADANARIAENPEMGTESMERIQSVILEAERTIEAYQPMVDLAEGPLVPDADERPLYKRSEQLREASRAIFGTPDQKFNDSFMSQLSEGFGSMFGFMIATIGTGPFGGAAAGAGVNSAAMYKRAKADGASEADAKGAAFVGAMLGTTEAVPIARAFRVVPTKIRSAALNVFGRVAARVFTTAGEEGLQEWFQEVGNNLIEKAGWNPEQKTFEGGGMAFLIGAILGAPMGAVSALTARGEEAVKAETAGSTAEMLKEIDVLALASKLKERSPEKFKEAVDASGLGDQTAYIAAEDVRTLFQEQGIDIPYAELGVDEDTFNNMLNTGGDIAVPLSNYAAFVSGSEAQEFFQQHARFDPADFSAAEASIFEATTGDLMAQAQEQAEAAIAAGEAVSAVDQNIYDNMNRQFQEAGRSPDVADKEARVWSSFFRTMAERYNQDAEALAERYGVQVRGPEQSSPNAQGTEATATGDVPALNGEPSPSGQFKVDPAGLVNETTNEEYVAIRKEAEAARLEDYRAREEYIEQSEDGIVPPDFGNPILPVLSALDTRNTNGELHKLIDVAVENGRPDLAKALVNLSQSDLLLEYRITQMQREEAAKEGFEFDEDYRAAKEAEAEGLVRQAEARINEPSPFTTVEQAAVSVGESTEAFKRWFGDSKVLDADGNPLVVYHGSILQGIEVFDTSLVTERGKGDQAGTYFTSDRNAASNYTRPRLGQPRVKGQRGSVTAAYLTIKNPMYTAEPIAALQKSGMSFGDAKREVLKGLDRDVHDGIIFEGDGVNPSEYVVFDPTQIKSVNNKGTFNPNDPRILEQDAAEIDDLRELSQGPVQTSLQKVGEAPVLNEEQMAASDAGAILPDASIYLFDTSDSIRVPLEQVKPIRARPEGIENARPLMAQAATNGSRRQPLTVRPEADGTYTLLDGNSTYAVLAEAGAPELVVRPMTDAEFGAEAEIDKMRKVLKDPKKKPRLIDATKLDDAQFSPMWKALRRQQPFATIEEMVETDDQLHDQDMFNEKVIELGKALGMTVKAAPAKNMKRSLEKSETKYRNDHRLLGDTVRSGFVVATPNQGQAMIEALATEYTIVDEGFQMTDAGYLDRKVSALLPSGRWAEVQVWPTGMLEAKSNGGQDMYNVYRENEGRYTPEEKQLALNGMHDLYLTTSSNLDPEWLPVVQEKMSGFADIKAIWASREELNSSSVISGARMSDNNSAASMGQVSAPENDVANPLGSNLATPSSVLKNRDISSPFIGNIDADVDTVELFQGGLHEHILGTNRQARNVSGDVSISEEEMGRIEASANETGISKDTIVEHVKRRKAAHPSSENWVEWTYNRTIVKDGKVSHFPIQVPYGYHTDANGKPMKAGSDQYKAAVHSLAAKMADEVFSVRSRAEAGDKSANVIMRQSGWYKEMRSRLRREFGGMGDLFADLLGATSPNTPVRGNWAGAVEALRLASSGKFDTLIDGWVEFYDNIDALEGDLSSWIAEQQAAGQTKKAIKSTAEYKAKLTELRSAKEFPESLLPKKSNGANFGFNGKNVARAMVDMWRIVQNASPDVGRGGTKPKALNFSGNLIGFRERATIDVWAARLLQRLSKANRIPSEAEASVKGDMKADASTTGMFGFGQDVFSEAVKMIRSQNPDHDMLSTINDDDLQAVAWFLEKEIWTKIGATNSAGEGGSFEFEADLTGNPNQEKIRGLRKIIDSTKTSPEDRSAAVEELQDYVQEADRFYGGLSIEQSEFNQGITFVPTDGEMAEVSERIRSAIYEGDPDGSVLGSKVFSTEGRYGDAERSFDVEVTARSDYDAGPLLTKMEEIASDNKQDSFFVSKVLRATEDVDPSKHRSGIEVYFREGASLEDVQPILDEIADAGGEYYTVVVDGRRTADALSGAVPKAVGIRMQYVPEFDVRYSDVDPATLTDEDIAKMVMDAHDGMQELAASIRGIDGVSFADTLWYDTTVKFSHEYGAKDGQDVLAGRPEGGIDQEAGSQPRVGQLVREGLEGAARQRTLAENGQQFDTSNRWSEQRRSQGSRELNQSPVKGPLYAKLDPSQIPQQTRKAYKLMMVQASRQGEVLPLYAKPEGARQGFTFGEWYAAENQRPTIGNKPLAERAGIHAVDKPVFDQGKAKVKGKKRVWVEVDMPVATPETQAESDASPVLANGMRTGINQRLIGPNESYDFRTNPNSSEDGGGWPISGSMRPVRVLSDTEVASILTEAGLENQIENSMAGITDAEAARLSGVDRTLEQGTGDGPRGSMVMSDGIASGKTVINLFESNDLSTVIHESGHFFFEVFNDMAHQPNASPEMLSDLEAIKKHTGWDGNGAIPTEAHEVFARTFEAYLMEGKAPSTALADVFSRAKQWLLRVYESVKLDAKLSPQIAEVFDRMLATDAEIEAARSEAEMSPLFSEAPAGMTDAEFKSYQKLARRSQESAEQALLAKAMDKVTREKKKWFKEEKAATRNEVEKRVNNEPVYILTEYLSNQRVLSDPDAIVGDVQIDKAILLEQFGPEAVTAMSYAKFKGKRGIYGDKGLNPIEVAQMFGFKNATEMVDILRAAPNRMEAIAVETDRVMLERHGDPFTDGSIEEEAMVAAHTEAQAMTVVTEARSLAKQLGRETGGMNTRTYRQRARIMISGMPVSVATKPAQFLAAERRASKKAQAAFSKVANGRGTATLAEAFQAKEQQVLNHMLYMEAKLAEEYVRKGRDKMLKYNNPAVRKKLSTGLREDGTRGVDYMGQIDAILENYEFRKRTKNQIARASSLNDYIEMMEEAGRSGELAIDLRLADSAKREHYTKLTMDEIRGVFDTIANIDHSGRHKQEMIDARGKRNLKAMTDAISGNIAKNMGTGKNGKEGKIRSFLDLIFTTDTILIEADGMDEYGASYEGIKERVDQGHVDEQRLSVELAEKLKDIFAKYSHKELRDMSQPKAVDGSNGTLWSKMQIITMALNTGNADNLKRILDPTINEVNRMTRDQLDATLDTLEKKDWDFAQETWDLVNSYWTQIADIKERQTGVRPKKVEAVPVVTKFGVYRGGYYPIKYDPNLSRGAALDEVSAMDKALSGGRGARAKTKDGFTVSRQATGGGRALSYDISGMFSHLREVVHNVALSEAIDNANRVLNSSDVTMAFLNAGRKNDLDALNLWLKDIANGPMHNADPVNAAARMLKNNFTLSRLAFNWKTVALQITGIGQSAATVGKKNMLLGYRDYMRNFGLSQEVARMSPFMAERMTTFQKDIYDMHNDTKLWSPIKGRYSQAKEMLSKTGFAPIVYVQYYGVDVPTFLAGYRAGMEKFGNDEAKAISYAERMVARSQDSGLMSDRGAMSRGSLSPNVRQADFVRLFTTLQGYMLTKLNRANITVRRGIKGLKEGDGAVEKAASAANMATDLALLYLSEAIMMGVMYGLMDKFGEDDADEEDYMDFIFQETGSAIFGGIPFGRDIYSSFSGYGGGGIYGSLTEAPFRAFQQAMQGDNDKALRTSIANVVGLSTGLPSTASMRVIEGLLDDDASIPEMIVGKNPLYY